MVQISITRCSSPQPIPLSILLFSVGRSNLPRGFRSDRHFSHPHQRPSFRQWNLRYQHDVVLSPYLISQRQFSRDGSVFAFMGKRVCLGGVRCLNVTTTQTTVQGVPAIAH